VLLAQLFAGYSFVQLAAFFILIVAVCAVVAVFLSWSEVPINPYLKKIAMIVAGAFVALFALFLLARMASSL
jgi:hypothetical protein